MQFTIKQGMNQDILKTYPDNYFDSIVTDPPYGIEFLGKDWDKNTGAIETWQECLRVLKPGGHLLAFSAARTYHHLATNIESVGFEIRDQIMWIYGSGFPKAQDICKNIDKRNGKKHELMEYHEEADGTEVESAGAAEVNRCVVCKSSTGPIHKKCSREDCPKPWIKPQADNEWAGWKTALKPAHEPIVMARKPFKGSCVDNVLEHGTGALNIDATRIPTDETIAEPKRGKGVFKEQECGWNKDDYNGEYKSNDQGRFPANVLGEIPEYQKYFYCPKVSRAERHCGFEKVQDDRPKIPGQHWGERQMGNLDHIEPFNKPEGGVNGSNGVQVLRKRDPQEFGGNNHPTVKPVELMKYLIKLVTPAGGRVLDPFNGSGSTGMAAVELGYEYTGCELDPNYVEIANRRIQGWYNRTRPDNNFNELFD